MVCIEQCSHLCRNLFFPLEDTFPRPVEKINTEISNIAEIIKSNILNIIHTRDVIRKNIQDNRKVMQLKIKKNITKSKMDLMNKSTITVINHTLEAILLNFTCKGPVI